MSPMQHDTAAKQWRMNLEETRKFCLRRGFEITCDQQHGFWLKDGESQRYLRTMEDCKSWADYLTGYKIFN